MTPDGGAAASPMETEGSKPTTEDLQIPNINDEVDHLRLPEGDHFWTDGPAMYLLAEKMESFIQYSTPTTDPQRIYMDLVKDRGEKIVSAVITRCGANWQELKSMSVSERESRLSSPPIKPRPAPLSYATIASAPPPAIDPATGHKYIRLRCSYTGKQVTRGIPAYASEVRSLLKSILTMGRLFDKGMMIAPWQQQGPTITIKSMMGINDDDMTAYIKMPSDKYMLNGRVNMIGIRLVTPVPGWQVVRNFSVLRYRNKQPNSSIIIKEASSHRSPQSFRLGYFQGTSPNGDYTTFTKEITNLTDEKVELTWQNIYVRGVTGKIWEMAKKEAEKVGTNNSSEYKRRKFQLAPEGLEAHVGNMEDIKPMKKLLIEKFGKRVQVSDGTVIRFIPFATNDSSMSVKMKTKLRKRLAWQCLSKAGEEKFAVSLQDIHDHKEYLGGKSLEQVIHEMESSNLRIFRHIGIRWNVNLQATDYDLIAHSSMIGEAANMVEKLKHYMFEYAKGDARIWTHFIDGSNNLSDSKTAAKLQKNDDNDDDVNAFYESDEDSDDDAIECNLLSPDFIQILQMQQGQALPFDDSSTMHGTKTTAQSNRSKGSDDSMQSVKSILTTDSNRTNTTGISGITWDEGVQDHHKKTDSQSLDDILKTKIKNWVAFAQWRDTEKVIYNAVCASRSTTTTKAASVLKLYSKVLKSGKTIARSDSTTRAAEADDPGPKP